ncbi:MAG TPA: hypothetical protein VMB76_03420 [Casimicrobiaceae bacterium]|jgi:hypothetical protein|nr:hypothetical protein [Casimicrobiaceae bacterium]
MKRHHIVVAGFTAFLFAALQSAESSAAQPGAPVKLRLQKIGATSFAAAPPTTDFTTKSNEIDDSLDSGDADNGAGDDDFGGVNRTLPGAVTGHGKPVKAHAKPKSNPALGTHFEGLNFNNQRFANGGNQFSIEPPDQGLCVGNGFVLETVNDVLRVYHTDGTPATGVVDLNTFYGYPAAINRVTNARGPTITDPSCIYDQAIGRFIHVVLTLDKVGTTAANSGNNHLDIAVSDTGDPTGSWTIYTLPVQNNGTQGTPDDGCNKGFCLGDYPHIGADANAIFLTTNEFAFFGPGFFYGSQIYGIGHNVLLGGTGSVVLFNTLGAGPDGAGFTVWPAQSPGSQFDAANGGTEYFLSSRAVFTDDGTSTSILMWQMTNTSSLNSVTPSPSMSLTTIAVDEYAVPPVATQPAGNHPLSDCVADTVIRPNCNTTIAGIGTHDNSNFYQAFGGPAFALNSNDSRMQQVFYANGKLWGALDTAVNIGDEDRAGIAYYAINPHSAKLELQGQAGIAHGDLTYPALAMTQSGRGVIAFTLTGDANFPSAAFAGVDDKVGMGDIQIAAAGAGPWDGFTSLVAFGAGRPRWGDYGAAAVDGQTIWIASEYAAQTCTYAAYLLDPTCGGTRGALSNWSTHVSHVTP